MFMFESGQSRNTAALRTSRCVRLFYEVFMDEIYIKKCLLLANKAYKHGDVPVGCIIVKNNKIVSMAYNTKNIKKCSINHAEILAIKKACKKLGTWHLDDCTLYVTMEPCLMCCGAILQSRIKKIVYGIDCSKFGYAGSICDVLNSKKNNHRVEIVSGILGDECAYLLKSFFSDKR